MVSSNKNPPQYVSRHGSTATSGVEPIGKVRRSQLISTYGIGAIIDLEKGSFMPMGLEDWESVTRLPALTIGEARLQAQLGVSHFRLPPAAEDISGFPGRVDPLRAAPAVRFPEWHECPKCHRLGTHEEPFQLAVDNARLECHAHGTPVDVTPVRFVVACRRGHIEEFPWVWWAHRRRSEGVCVRPSLKLESRGRSAALADLFVHCSTCNSEGSLGDAFQSDSMRGRSCYGARPWLYDRELGCDAPPKVIQRGASNAHFAIIASALSIPPVSEAMFQIVDQQWMMLSAVPEEAIDPMLSRLASMYGVSKDALWAVYREKLKIEGLLVDVSESSSRSEEYAALSIDRDDPVVGGIQPQFCNSVDEPKGVIGGWFDLIGAVSRLREVRALAGFSRIEPYPVSAGRIRAAIEAGFISPLSKAPKSWLPAAEIRGEGIFLRFRAEAIDDWLTANPAVRSRVAKLEARSAAIARERGYDREYELTPRLLLVHSFAHALIRTISVDCGYSSSSLRERLFVSEARDAQPAMNGVLIYTGSPDSEGSLGGLVRLASPDQIERIVMRSLRAVRWCGSDPVCLETEPEESGDKVSGAACHCCLLVPETSCEKFNRELDRSMLVGSAVGMDGDSWNGFFGSSLD